MRKLDEIVGDELFNGGKSLGPGMGKLRIETGKPFSEEIKVSFREDIPDHRILAIADYITKKNPKQKTILVTKDINLRMKAKSIGIISEDYKTDQVSNTDVFEKSVMVCENFSDTLIDKLYENGSFNPEEEKWGNELESNECFIMRGSKSSVLARFDPSTRRIFRVEKKSAYGIKPRNAEQTFSLNMLMNPDIKLCALTGKAGTGKTLLALAAAVEQYKSFDQILLARPIVALSNRDLGFLPGDAGRGQ